MATQTKSILLNGVSTPEQLFNQFDARYAPERFEVPDYPDSVVEVTMLSAGAEEHCAQYARLPDGARNADAFLRIFCAYAIASPKLVEHSNARIQAEKIAAIFERAPADWLAPIFEKAWGLTYEYQRKRNEREREDANNASFFPKRASAPSSSAIVSDDSPPKS